MKKNELDKALEIFDTEIKKSGLSRREAFKVAGLGGAAFLLWGSESEAATIAKANGLTQVASTTYEGNAVKVYGKSDASETNLKEVLITVNGDFNGYKTSVLSIKGDFPLSEIALIAEKLKLPVSDALNKLDKK